MMDKVQIDPQMFEKIVLMGYGPKSEFEDDRATDRQKVNKQGVLQWRASVTAKTRRGRTVNFSVTLDSATDPFAGMEDVTFVEFAGLVVEFAPNRDRKTRQELPGFMQWFTATAIRAAQGGMDVSRQRPLAAVGNEE